MAKRFKYRGGLVVLSRTPEFSEQLLYIQRRTDPTVAAVDGIASHSRSCGCVDQLYTRWSNRLTNDFACLCQGQKIPSDPAIAAVHGGASFGCCSCGYVLFCHFCLSPFLDCA